MCNTNDSHDRKTKNKGNFGTTILIISLALFFVVFVLFICVKTTIHIPNLKKDQKVTKTWINAERNDLQASLNLHYIFILFTIMNKIWVYEICKSLHSAFIYI